MLGACWPCGSGHPAAPCTQSWCPGAAQAVHARGQAAVTFLSRMAPGDWPPKGHGDGDERQWANAQQQPLRTWAHLGACGASCGVQT